MIINQMVSDIFLLFSIIFQFYANHQVFVHSFHSKNYHETEEGKKDKLNASGKNAVLIIHSLIGPMLQLTECFISLA